MKTYEVYIADAKDPFIIKAIMIKRDEKEGLVFYGIGGISPNGKEFSAPVAYAPKNAIVYVIADSNGGPISER